MLDSLENMNKSRKSSFLQKKSSDKKGKRQNAVVNIT
jgi:hypothetical protein